MASAWKVEIETPDGQLKTVGVFGPDKEKDIYQHIQMLQEQRDNNGLPRAPLGRILSITKRSVDEAANQTIRQINTYSTDDPRRRSIKRDMKVGDLLRNYGAIK